MELFLGTNVIYLPLIILFYLLSIWCFEVATKARQRWFQVKDSTKSSDRCTSWFAGTNICLNTNWIVFFCTCKKNSRPILRFVCLKWMNLGFFMSHLILDIFLPLLFVDSVVLMK